MNFLILESKQTLHLIFIHWQNLAFASIENKNKFHSTFLQQRFKRFLRFSAIYYCPSFLLLKMMRAMAGKALELIECEIPFL